MEAVAERVTSGKGRQLLQAILTARRAERVLDLKAARAAALDLLARKAWSRRDLTARLRRRGAPADVVGAVVSELESRGYLDDAQFARRWVETRAGSRRLGPARLRSELRARGVDAELAEAAIREAFGRESEASLALAAGRKRLPVLEKRDPGRAPVRLSDYLLRRGYPGGVVAQVVRTLCKLGDAGPE
ncbi:MAG: hypothetical protein DMD82_05200 [Candidatus Rokuibacteriota bacterium]|nr:MAG: hypothetical protein DMD82_05200 [Candidatus Rokubacteria bacterium]